MRIRFTTLLIGCLASWALAADTLTLPLDQRPDWLARDGIVMAGSWEPLPFRVRRDGSDVMTPTPEQQDAYAREHSPQMIEQLKALGVNFVMMHCYKGAGLQAERQSMTDAVAFSKSCHEAGLRVGVYACSGAFLWEPLFQQLPQARNWLILDANGQPVPYGKATYRYYWNRNHPDAQAFYRKIIRFAVQDIQTDLIHLDNHNVGPGSEPNSVDRFKAFLAERFTPAQRATMGITDLQSVRPPLMGTTADPLYRAWLDFSSQSLADAYADMGRYVRTLRKDVLMECNPGGPGDAIRPPVDHARLLPSGEAFWDESLASGYRDGKLATRIQTYKIARRMDNIAFAYTTTPIEAAEAMAFNRDCFGCICWFEYGKIVARPGFNEPMSPDLAPYIKLFHARRDLLRDAEVVADVAVLRSFPSQAFAERKWPALTHRVEQDLIENRVPFQIIYDSHLSELARYRILVLAGWMAISNGQIKQVRDYIAGGGRVCIVGPVATHDEWMNPRTESPFNTPHERVMRIAESDDLALALRSLAGDPLSLEIDGPPGLCAELTRQPNRTLVHLVNYRSDQTARDVKLRLRVPATQAPTSVRLVSPDSPEGEPVQLQIQGKRVEFTVPMVKVYAIAVIEHAANSVGNPR